MFDALPWTAIVTGLLHSALVIGIALRVISTQRATGEALAWIAIVVFLPAAGAVIYALVGETWLSGHRARRTAELAKRIAEPGAELYREFGVELDTTHPAAEAVARLGRHVGHAAVLGSNEVELIGDDESFFDPLIADIERAEHTVHLLYYIWESEGRVVDVENALLRAARRGVDCRVLVDASGGKHLLRGYRRDVLEKGGVQVRDALPVNPLRGKLGRLDIRNHRKLASIDNAIAYVGSHNMVDPDHFMAGAGFGQWVDLTTRVEGPGASILGALFEIDWAMESAETEETLKNWRPFDEPGGEGDDAVQVVPSGPGQSPDAMYRMLSAAVYGARERLIMTTPYFVPDTAFTTGVVSAAMRGVDVTVVVPEKINGPLVAAASRAYYEELIDAGVKVYAYRGGLLHAKTVTVDDALAIIGTVNLDRRSFWLNYELSLVVQGGPFVATLREVQEGYIADSHLVAESPWMHRGSIQRLAENAAKLLSPIL